MSSSKWQRTGITPDILKDFFYMYATTKRKTQLSEGGIAWVRVSDVIPKNQDWQQTIWRYSGLMSRIDNKTKEFTDSAFWKHEKKNRIKDIQKRLDRFKRLYRSIKATGFIMGKRNHIKLLDLCDVKRKRPEKGGRISCKYYRCNGMKRILICAYLGINKIPVKLYRVSIG